MSKREEKNVYGWEAYREKKIKKEGRGTMDLKGEAKGLIKLQKQEALQLPEEEEK